ncbi:hypothetical protein [Paracidovorax citrulli]
MTPAPAKARRRRSRQTPTLRLVDWEVRPGTQGEVKLAFVAVTDDAEEGETKVAGHSYQISEQELRRLIDELSRELDPARRSLLGERSTEVVAANETPAAEASPRTVLSAYGLLGN